MNTVELPDEEFFRRSEEERQKIMSQNPPGIGEVFNGAAYFTWHWQGCGFGELSFKFNPETGKFDCMNECMGPESVRKFLHAYADYVADNINLMEGGP